MFQDEVGERRSRCEDGNYCNHALETMYIVAL